MRKKTMRTNLVLQNSFKYQGDIISETIEHITINDIKRGKTTILKDAIMVRSDFESGDVE